MPPLLWSRSPLRTIATCSRYPGYRTRVGAHAAGREGRGGGEGGGALLRIDATSRGPAASALLVANPAPYSMRCVGFEIERTRSQDGRRRRQDPGRPAAVLYARADSCAVDR